MTPGGRYAVRRQGGAAGRSGTCYCHCREPGYAWDAEVIAVAQAVGVAVVEVPVHWRHDDRSKVNVGRDGLAMLAAMPRIWRSAPRCRRCRWRRRRRRQPWPPLRKGTGARRSSTTPTPQRSPGPIVRTGGSAARPRWSQPPCTAAWGRVTIGAGWSTSGWRRRGDGAAGMATRSRRSLGGQPRPGNPGPPGPGLAAVRTAADRVPVADGAAEVVCLLDVIEHLRPDRGAQGGWPCAGTRRSLGGDGARPHVAVERRRRAARAREALPRRHRDRARRLGLRARAAHARVQLARPARVRHASWRGAGPPSSVSTDLVHSRHRRHGAHRPRAALSAGSGCRSAHPSCAWRSVAPETRPVERRRRSHCVGPGRASGPGRRYGARRAGWGSGERHAAAYLDTVPGVPGRADGSGPLLLVARRRFGAPAVLLDAARRLTPARCRRGTGVLRRRLPARRCDVRLGRRRPRRAERRRKAGPAPCSAAAWRCRYTTTPSTCATRATSWNTSRSRSGWPTRWCVSRGRGVVFLSWTTWLSPWGGHETSPWHYLGAPCGPAVHPAQRAGAEEQYGRTLSRSRPGACRAGFGGPRRPTASTSSTHCRATTRDGHTGFAAVPGVREVACWNRARAPVREPAPHAVRSRSMSGDC